MFLFFSFIQILILGETVHVNAMRCDTVPSLVSADMGWSVLKTTFGKFLQIQMFESTLMLCVEEVQNEDENGTPGY